MAFKHGSAASRHLLYEREEPGCAWVVSDRLGSQNHGWEGIDQHEGLRNQAESASPPPQVTNYIRPQSS